MHRNFTIGGVYVYLQREKNRVKTMSSNAGFGKKDKVAEALKRALNTQLELKHSNVPNHHTALLGWKRKRHGQDRERPLLQEWSKCCTALELALLTFRF